MKSVREKVVVGIDLGTTNSLIATFSGGQPLVLPNALGSRLTPSAVSVDGDEVLVGSAAYARHATHPNDTALVFKRDMGADLTRKLGRRSFSPQELSAMVLASLTRDAEATLGVEVVEAVVTVPAYFGERQRQATRDAAAIAGLHVERIINEPTAAAMAYGLHELDRELKAVVLDLGGGTFDVTVLEIMEGVIEIQSSAGDARLGGEDFALALAALASAQLKAKLGHAPTADTSLARLREAAERAKCRLTEDEETDLALPALEVGGAAHDVALSFSRPEVEVAWAPLIERCRHPILRALSDAGARAADIDEVILVGGATRMPCFVRLASQIFDRLPRRDLPVDEVVAMGAAVQAALKAGDAAVEDVVVTDVAPFSMGMETSTLLGQREVRGLYTPIIERGTTIPVSRVERFFTLASGQRRIDVKVFQGEHSLCKDNTFLGSYQVKGLPPKPAGEVGVDVRFSYDLNGILEVEMNIAGSDKKEHLVIEERPGKLSKKQIERAREAMAKLKFHPRDTLPNRTALARADALYVELTGLARDELGAHLARFRAALESQDSALIDETRAQLLAVIDAFTR
ncbi:MAG: Hsp70 family protein [Deltaproteobacteria bacterium]|nr:Hsp70 family protein [Deltaproteobacteria bacterium]